MEKLNGPIAVNTGGMRICTVFCQECGGTTMTEDDALSRVECADCGGTLLRIVRDLNYEQFILREQTGGVPWNQ